MLVDLVSDILALLTVIGNIGIIAFLVLYLSSKKNKKLLAYAKKYGLQFAFLVTLLSTLGSLFYSDVAGYNPCKLCWIQRIFMYPQTFILGVALYKKYKKEIVDYCLALSIIGTPIAAYHYYLQRWGGSDTPCSAVGYSESCAKNFVLTFGYITIPLMALTAFLLIIISLILYRKSQ